MVPVLSQLLQAVVTALRDAGGRPYLVGGGVRDRLLGAAPKDDDVEVYGLAADRVREACARVGRVEAVGAAFGVLKITLGAETVDVSLPRRDSKTGAGHAAFAIATAPDLPMAEAVRRRDFTVNALLLDPFTGALHDLVGGLDDLAERRLRAVDARLFADDPLRALRACRFAARLHFRLDAQTLALCRNQPLDALSCERIGQEMIGLLQAPSPAAGLRTLAAMWSQRWFPELFALMLCPQDPASHPEGDVWTHTVYTVARIREMTDDRGLLLAALCHDLGKPLVTTRAVDGPRAGRWIAHGHDEAGVEPARRLLGRLTIDHATRERVVRLVQHHMAPMVLYRNRASVTAGAFRRLARELPLLDLATLGRADQLARGGVGTADAAAWFEQRVRALDLATSPPAPLLRGRDLLPLGVAPGPAMGQLLARAYDAQLEDRFRDLAGALAFVRPLLPGTCPTSHQGALNGSGHDHGQRGGLLPAAGPGAGAAPDLRRQRPRGAWLLPL
jgi:tRNA nucleotidyltransferase (CCA-adding enzyme)